MSDRGTRGAVRRARPVRLRAALRSALDAISDAPALVLTGRLDVVATNALGRALLVPVLVDDRPNLARFLFLDGASTAFFPEWDRVADEQVHRLRAAAEHDPHDRSLHRLVGELSTTSVPFRTRWSAKRLCACHPPRLLVDHPLVGQLELVREDLAPVADTALMLRICTAQVGSASDERLRILASWHQGTQSNERKEQRS